MLTLTERCVETVQKIIAVPYDIAFDAKKRKLYWTNSFGKIQRINVDGTDFKDDFITNLNTPKHIAFDMVIWKSVGSIGRRQMVSRVHTPTALGDSREA